ncbi:hypothetical protein T12_15435 [Trichinella patagoniensis]|uniref:Uncharacterized protein n=1 Tax=Trichinella patagoniensis TaxID=990121 RepID=A0A0V0ZD60_9BILA|nr:hypothetical protein T12_15435 [Trichinella patagoniensis]
MAVYIEVENNDREWYWSTRTMETPKAIMDCVLHNYCNSYAMTMYTANDCSCKECVLIHLLLLELWKEVGM